MNSVGLRWNDSQIEFLDQTLLPHQEVWKKAETFEDMVEAIHSLRVRGAPLIGVAAAASYAQQVLKGLGAEALRAGAAKLVHSRPTAVNLKMAVDRCLSATDPVQEAQRIFLEDQKLCEQIGNFGAPLFDKFHSIMTYCNAGALATAGIGTALGVIRKAASRNAALHVFVPETRPLLQGARLTEWELQQEGISHTLICDNMIGSLMAKKKIEAVVLGADRIAKNGDFANKIGTYNVAVLARHHGVPFYVAAPYTTVDMNCLSGAEIVIEERHAEEVRGEKARKEALVYNPAFDVTPASLVTGYILDSGVHTAINTASQNR